MHGFGREELWRSSTKTRDRRQQKQTGFRKWTTYERQGQMQFLNPVLVRWSSDRAEGNSWQVASGLRLATASWRERVAVPKQPASLVPASNDPANVTTAQERESVKEAKTRRVDNRPTRAAPELDEGAAPRSSVLGTTAEEEPATKEILATQVGARASREEIAKAGVNAEICGEEPALQV